MIGWRFSDPGSNPLRDMLEQIMAERRRGSGGDWMPVNVFEGGVLTIRVPKVRPRTPEKIRIQVNRRDSGG